MGFTCKNFARSTLASNLNIGGTSLSLQSGHGAARFSIRDQAEQARKLIDHAEACAKDRALCVVIGHDLSDPVEQLKAANAALDALERKLEAKRVAAPKLQT